MSRKRNRRKKNKQPPLGFWPSLEYYVYKRIADSHVPWAVVALAGVAIMIGASTAAGYFSKSPLFGSRSDVIKWAAAGGDYATAQILYENGQEQMTEGQKILGAGSELEEVVYPEKKVENQIERDILLNEKYPGNRDLLLHLSDLYAAIGNSESAEITREQARKLDPNNEIFKKDR